MNPFSSLRRLGQAEPAINKLLWLSMVLAALYASACGSSSNKKGTSMYPGNADGESGAAGAAASTGTPGGGSGGSAAGSGAGSGQGADGGVSGATDSGAAGESGAPDGSSGAPDGSGGAPGGSSGAPDGSGGVGIAGSSGAGGSLAGSGGSIAVSGAGGSGPPTPGDITLTVIANPDPAVSNGLVLYEFKITNTGGSPLTNVVLTDTTQNAAKAYQPQITGGGGCGNQVDVYNYCNAGTIVTWPAFTLAAGETRTMWLPNYVLNAVANGTVIHNTATVTFAGKTVMQPRDVTVDATVALHLGITEDVNPVHAGAPLTYTVTVGNTGTQTLPLSNTGVLTATIPAGMTFVSATAGGSSANGKVQWNLGAVDPGQTQHYSYTVTVAAALADGTVLLPSAEFLDGSTSLTRALSLTEVRGAAPLSLEVISNPDSAAPNELVSYELKLTNTSAGTLTNVVLSDSTQLGASVYQPEVTGGGNCGNQIDVYNYCQPGTIVSWPGFTLSPGQTQTVWMTSLVANAAPSGTLIRNQARVAYTGGMVIETSDLTVNSKPYLRLGLVEDHNPVRSGDQLTYTIAVGNTGSVSLPISNAGVLAATLPVGTTFVSASPGGTSANGKVQWNVSSINPGTDQHYTYTVSVGSGLADGTVLLPSAALLDGTTSVARATSLTEVRDAIPLKVTMVANPDPAPSNGLVWYELRVTNTGSTTITNAALSEVVQNAASSYQPETTGGGTCAVDVYNYCRPGTIVSWPGLTLTAGQTQTVSISTIVAANTASGTLVRNQARLSYAGGTVLATKDLAVGNTSNLHVDMTTDRDPVHPGDKLTYTLSVSNTGTQALPLSSAGILSAKVPPGSTFASASTGGVNSNGVVKWSFGFVNPGATQKYSFAVNVGNALGDGSLLESAAELLDVNASLARTTTSTEVRAATPLTLDVTVTPDPVAPNALATYTFVVTNTSADTLTNIVLSDVTQNAGSAYQPSTTGGGTCGSALDVYSYCNPGTIISWPAATLTSGQALTVTRTDKIANAIPNGTLVHNQARVAYATGTILKATTISTHQ